MKTSIKFVVLPLAGIVVAIVAIAAYVAATFDPNQYKPQIVQAVKDKTKRVLKLEGDIKLSLFPNIGATLGKISLSEFGSDREFAGIEDFRVSLKLLPLLSKEVVVDSIEVKEPAREPGALQGRQDQHRRPDRRRQARAGREKLRIAGQDRHRLT